AYARERVPQGDFRTGDLETLPYADDRFDVVTGGNSFQYAGDPIAALREARRVVKPGGSVAMVVWGRQEECESGRVMMAMGTLMPPPPPGAAGPFALSVPGKIEAMMEEAGLTPVSSGDVPVVYEWPDIETATRAFLASGPGERIMQVAGEAAAREAMRPVLDSLGTNTGGVRSANAFHYVIARK
ncbi:MAG: class I SAM-dependent methyltransferase, partial [Chloroflexota bacterium]|nr:class I SAM-dependent methyltransferase [Chloroflexota bacterium]